MSNRMSNGDLKHRDWLLYSTKSILLSVDQGISVFIEDTPNGGKILRATQISEENIGALPFIVNTDQNNNYLYLQDFKVYIQGYIAPVDIPGIVPTFINVFRNSDINGFLSNQKTHLPFNPSNFKGLTVSEFVDQYTALQPYTLDTLNYFKFYEIVLNPDQEGEDDGTPNNTLTGTGTGNQASASFNH